MRNGAISKEHDISFIFLHPNSTQLMQHFRYCLFQTNEDKVETDPNKVENDTGRDVYIYIAVRTLCLYIYCKLLSFRYTYMCSHQLRLNHARNIQSYNRSCKNTSFNRNSTPKIRLYDIIVLY